MGQLSGRHFVRLANDINVDPAPLLARADDVAARLATVAPAVALTITDPDLRPVADELAAKVAAHSLACRTRLT